VAIDETLSTAAGGLKQPRTLLI